MRRTAGYVHFYEDQTTPDQVLSGPMRELIATCQLCAKNDDASRRTTFGAFTAWRHNKLLFEAAKASRPSLAGPRFAHIAKAIITRQRRGVSVRHAAARRRTEELTPFADLTSPHDGHDRERRPARDAEWQYVRRDRPRSRAPRGRVRRSLSPRQRRSRQAASDPARELIAIAALCARGEVDIAAHTSGAPTLTVSPGARYWRLCRASCR